MNQFFLRVSGSRPTRLDYERAQSWKSGAQPVRRGSDEPGGLEPQRDGAAPGSYNPMTERPTRPHLFMTWKLEPEWTRRGMSTSGPRLC
jgi:hypothetical protein